MYKKLSYILSILLHCTVLAFAFIIPYRHVVTAEKYVPVQLAPMEEVQEQQQEPQPPEPEPEPEPEKKISDETKKKIQDLLRTPLPTKRPTATATPKPTKKPSPTSKPTQKPKPTSTPTKAPVQSPTPTPIENKRPITELDNRAVSRNVENVTAETITVQGVEGKNYSEYAALLNAILANNWRTPSVHPSSNKKYTTIVSFTINKDGRITNFKINGSSGWILMDQSVQQAVERSSPLRKLPPDFFSGTLHVTVPFIFNPR